MRCGVRSRPHSRREESEWYETEDVLYSASYDDTVKTWKEDLDGDDWSCSGTTTSARQHGLGFDAGESARWWEVLRP